MAGHDLSSLRDASSWPASGSTPTPTSGPPRRSACRSSTTGGRPRPAGRSPRTCAGSSRCRSRPARRRCACPATTCRCSTSSAKPVPAGEEGAIAIRLPLPPGTLPTLWQDDERYVAGYLSAYDGYYLTGDGGLHRRGRLRLRHGPHRRRPQRRGPPALDRVDRGGARRAPRRRRVRGHRRRRRPQGPGAARARRAQGRCRRHRAEGERICAELVQRVRDEVGAVAACARSTSSRRCPRPARARSCARRCARSPTAGPPPCPAPSRTCPCSTPSVGAPPAADPRSLRRSAPPAETRTQEATTHGWSPPKVPPGLPPALTLAGDWVP